MKATHLAVGDGNGATPEHTSSDSGLVNEVWRGPLQAVYLKENGETANGKYVVFEGHVPLTVGGWYIREVAIYADDVLLAIGSHPTMWKPDPDNETDRMEHIVRMPVCFSNTATITLTVDPTVVLASQKNVAEAIAGHDSDSEAHSEMVAGLAEKNHVHVDYLGKTETAVNAEKLGNNSPDAFVKATSGTASKLVADSSTLTGATHIPDYHEPSGNKKGAYLHFSEGVLYVLPREEEDNLLQISIGGKTVWHSGNDITLGRLDRAGRWDKQQYHKLKTIEGTPPSEAGGPVNVVWDVETAPVAYLKVDRASMVMKTPLNIQSGAQYFLVLLQSPEGGWPLAFEDGVYWWKDGIIPDISIKPYGITIISFFGLWDRLHGVVTRF
ncbi:MAG: phage tail protein [Desulfovibrio sp.]